MTKDQIGPVHREALAMHGRPGMDAWVTRVDGVSVTPPMMRTS